MDSRTIIEAHNADFMDYSASFLNVEFVFDSHREHIKDLAAVREEFFIYFDKYPKVFDLSIIRLKLLFQYRHLRLCSTVPGECSVCDSIYIDMVKEMVKKCEEAGEPQQPYKNPGTKSAQMWFKSSGFGKTSLTASYPRRQKVCFFADKKIHLLI